MYRISILPLLLLVGVASCKYMSSHGNKNVFQPIVLGSQSRRICAELCAAGLGGRACGEDCLDNVPQSLPVQFQSANDTRVNGTETTVLLARIDVCPVLCVNHLGYPLCNCTTNPRHLDSRDVDFLQICGNVCINLNYKIDGCQSCDVYERAAEKHGMDAFSPTTTRSVATTIDWEAWCKAMCKVGDGGLACNCDILPLNLQIN